MSDLEELKIRLKKLERTLQELMEQSAQDLEIAQLIQQKFSPNRLPQMPGIELQARYIPAGLLSSDSFQFFPSRDGLHLWWVAAWTESFGISSLLLQSLMMAQSQDFFAQNRNQPSELIRDLAMALTESPRTSGYRLQVIRLDLRTLELHGASVGMPPLLIRKKARPHWGSWELAAAQEWLIRPSLMEPGNSSIPLPEKTHTFQIKLEPGQRVAFVSPTFCLKAPFKDWVKNLNLTDLSTQTAQDSTLLNDLNSLLGQAQQHLQTSKNTADISGIFLEISEKKLHLA